ncbi:MAG: hypothetical protein R3F19_32870 [Verrucomicrobiales bacterium]
MAGLERWVGKMELVDKMYPTAVILFWVGLYADILVRAYLLFTTKIVLVAVMGILILESFRNQEFRNLINPVAVAIVSLSAISTLAGAKWIWKITPGKKTQQDGDDQSPPR